MMTTLSSVFTLAQSGGTESASPGLVPGLIGALVGALIGGAIYGLILMLLSGPVGKVKVGFGPAFKTMFVVALVSGVIGVLLTMVIGSLGGLVQFASVFVLSMLLINKNHNITMGRSAAIAGILMAIAIVIAVVLVLVLAGVLVAAGAAGKA